VEKEAGAGRSLLPQRALDRGAADGSAIPIEEALQSAAEIASRFPCDASLFAAVSGVYLRCGHGIEALGLARRAVRLSPASTEVQAHLACVCRVLGRLEEAAAIYRQLTERPGEKGSGYLTSWAEALTALNDPRAEALFAEARARACEAGDDLACAFVYERWGPPDAGPDGADHGERAAGYSPEPLRVSLAARRGTDVDQRPGHAEGIRGEAEAVKAGVQRRAPAFS
jgi:hypothetical protein